ncbi:MAG: hypothetical protein GC159_06610 [Phycisphaera sp.]|nr:hypothetical protein [Phycisphaera sp.]
MNDTPTPDRDWRELDELMQLVLDGDITDDRHARLAEILTDDLDAQRRYMRFTTMHTLLDWKFVGDEGPLALEPTVADAEVDGDGAGSRVPSRAPAPIATFRPFRYAAAAALVIVTGVAAALMWHAGSGPTQPATTQSRAVTVTLSDTSGAVWGAGSLNADAGVGPVDAGAPLVLDAGVAQIVLESGAVVKLAGPTELTVTGANSARLTRGRLVAFVPVSAHGFYVDTPDMRVTDLGTRFGVRVDPAGTSDVQVFEGRVHVRGDTSAVSIDRQLTAGQGVRTSDRAVEMTIATNEQAFLDGAPLDHARLPVNAGWVDMIRRADPLAYWRFDTPADGTRIDDVTDHGRGLRAMGGVTFDAAARFDGTGGALAVDRAFDDLTRGPYSVELWVRPDESLNRNAAIVALMQGERAHRFLIELNPEGRNDHRLTVRLLHRVPAGSTGGVDVRDTDGCTPGVWHHIVGVCGANELTLYVDGERVASAPDVTPTDPQPVLMHMGRRFLIENPVPAYFAGRLDEVAVYPRALAAEEVRRHFTAMRYARQEQP